MHDILVVDDESEIRSLVIGLLNDSGYQTREAANSDEVFEEILFRCPNLVLLDISLQGSKLDGLSILVEIKLRYPNIQVVIMSCHSNLDTVIEAIKNGAYDFVEKPFQSDRLLLAITRAIESSELRREVETLKYRIGYNEELLGQSSIINQLRQKIERVAPTDSRVLITGPAGVGKEIVSRLIHRFSNRASGPLIFVNCAIMHPERMEAELFGDESVIDGGIKIGTFEQSHGGTIVLDEVADMPLITQGKIVRIIQEQSFKRIGGNKNVEVNIRIIATTNRNLLEEIEEGRFRKDLYYRLNVVPLSVPALCERREDIPILARHFIQHTAQVSGLSVRSISDDAMAVMQTYNWPGNVRQLRNLMDWLLIMAPGDSHKQINVEMLPQEILSNNSFMMISEKNDEIVKKMTFREARREFEREYLQMQLIRFNGNISQVAAFTNIERSSLHRKLKLLKIIPIRSK
jgi:two-component system nitrogen regulation response regulator NtrX